MVSRGNFANFVIGGSAASASEFKRNGSLPISIAVMSGISTCETDRAP
jgi:hypothetical protein